MTLMREWCISHLCHLSLVDVFGTHLDPAKCKNKDARKFFADVRSVVETINKSEALKDIVDAFTKDEFGYFIKQKNASGHRWSSNAVVLERLIGAHSPIVSAFRQQKKVCKVAEHKNILIEFYSVFVPVREIQIMAQSMKTFVVIDIYVMMCELLLTVLDPMSPLLIRDSTAIPFGTPHPLKEERIPTMIDPRTQHVRKLLRQAFCKRFYDRYHPINALKFSNMLYRTHIINGEAAGYLDSSSLNAGSVKFSYVIDMQVMLFPGLQNGELIDNMVQTLDIEDQDVPNGWLVQDLRKSFINLLKDYIWRSITKLAELVAEGLIKDKQSNVTCSSSPLASDNEPALKRPKTLMTISSILSRQRLDQPTTQSELTPESMAKAEIHIFKALDLKIEVEPQQACKWWGMKS